MVLIENLYIKLCYILGNNYCSMNNWMDGQILYFFSVWRSKQLFYKIKTCDAVFFLVADFQDAGIIKMGLH